MSKIIKEYPYNAKIVCIVLYCQQFIFDSLPNYIFSSNYITSPFLEVLWFIAHSDRNWTTLTQKKAYLCVNCRQTGNISPSITEKTFAVWYRPCLWCCIQTQNLQKSAKPNNTYYVVVFLCSFFLTSSTKVSYCKQRECESSHTVGENDNP